MFLRGLSKVLNDLISMNTQPGNDGTREIPFDGDKETTEAFLQWAYNRPPAFTASIAHVLAYTAHKLDAPGN
jgi:hypothetical protein